MRIGIVLHPFGNSGRGLEQYVFESARSVIAEAPLDTVFTLFVKGAPDTSMFGTRVTVVNLPNSFFWNFHLFQFRSACDAFVFFTESAPIFLWKKSIIVFFDAAYYRFCGPSLGAKLRRLLLVWWRTRMLCTVRHIVTISIASKDDLVHLFSIAAERITVIYSGFKALHPMVGTSPYTDEKPYFVYVGPAKERKNVLKVIEAFNIFRTQTNVLYKLILVGRKSKGVYAEQVSQCVLDSPFREAITFKTTVTDAELPGVYQHAEALVFPSLLEGFGLPVLEALSLGCMVITSSTTSTKEALGDAGFLVDPTSVEDIVQAMTQVAHGYNREEFLRKAAHQCTKFSWQKSGKEWNALLVDAVTAHSNPDHDATLS